MKFLHISDLHIGKKVNGFSMIDEQEYILKKIINIAVEQCSEVVLIAGDVYDKSVASEEAVQLFDKFLCCLSKHNLKVFVISGNHDSDVRMAFGSELMNKSDVYMSPVYSGNVSPVTLTDEYGEINVYMLPFIKPSNVRRFFEDKQINTYTDAIRTAIYQMNIDKSKRNIIVTHQFVTGAITSDSEEISVGGSDNVDVSVFDDFDYVALGHIHRPQKIKRDTVRYCGTPLKYSFSEAKDKKSVTIVEIKEKGNVKITTIPLIPKHDMREIKGTYNEVTLKSNYQDTNVEDYIHITLTDEEDIPDATGKLRLIYPNLMKIDYDNIRTRNNNIINNSNSKERTPFELFSELFEKQNNQPMNDTQSEYIKSAIKDIWEG